TLLMDRMNQSQFGIVAQIAQPQANQQQQPPDIVPPRPAPTLNRVLNNAAGVYDVILTELAKLAPPAVGAPQAGLAADAKRVKAILLTFSFQEGLYLDSNEVTFEASWRLMTTFRAIFAASGLWRMVTHEPAQAADRPWDTDKTLWRTTMK